MGTLKRRIIESMEPKEQPPMESKSYTLTVGDVLHNLTALADNYEKISAGKQDGFACDTAAAAANLRAAVQMIQWVPVWIPVSERLPEPDALVLVVLPKQADVHESGVYIGCLHGSLMTFATHFGFGFHASHWMPLPGPPETKQ
jgi:hypothetical protein